MIEDAAVAYYMPRCQMVLSGAEAVAESGGIINKTGTYASPLPPTPRPSTPPTPHPHQTHACMPERSMRGCPWARRYQMAIVAAACKKPFYVASESTKFARMFPLSQQDLPPYEQKLEHAAFVGKGPPPDHLKAEQPSRDYTPPQYITMLFTDLGVLTPSAVSDELIKLFD